MKKVYIITTYTGTLLSRLIKNISKTPYAHVSISLNEELKPMYAFGRLNPKTPIFAGFVEENINEGLYAIRKNTMCRVYSLDVTDLQHEKIYESIMNVSKNREQYDYDVKALLDINAGKDNGREYKYVCSHFVADMLIQGGVEIIDKHPYKTRPNDFYNLEGLTLEYEGLLSKYSINEYGYMSTMVEA